MYISAGMTLPGATLLHESISISIYPGLFFLTTQLFMVLYEEPTLRRIMIHLFGSSFPARHRKSEPE